MRKLILWGMLLILGLGTAESALAGQALVAISTSTPVLSPTPTATETAAVTATFTVTITPTLTPTVLPTGSPTPTSTEVVVALVRLNHNRFNPAAGESLQIMGLKPEHGDVAIKVFTTSGYLVREWTSAGAAGDREAAWDGRNQQDQVVASGVYVVVVTGNRLHKRLRIAVLK